MKRKPLLLICLFLAIAILASCNNSPVYTQDESTEQANLEFIEKENLETAYTPHVSAETEHLQSDELEQHLIQDLLNRPYLIPFQPPYPHMAQFFFTDVSALEDGYVFAEGEDGHVNFEMILAYFINEDGRIVWEVVSYVVGYTTYPNLENGNEVAVDGVISGDVFFFYREVSVSRLFTEPIIDVLGQPLGSREAFLFYHGLEIMAVWNYGLEPYQGVAAQLDAWTPYLGLFELNGFTLDMARAELIAAFGVPVQYYNQLISYHLSNPIADYTLVFRFDNPDDETEITSISMFRMYWQVE